MLFAAAALALTMQNAAFAQNASADLKKIIDDHWAWTMKENPTFATSLGVRDYDDTLGNASLASYDAAIASEKEFIVRLDALDRKALSADEQLTLDLLRLDLANDVEGSKFGDKYLVISNRFGPHNYITGLAEELPFFTRRDYESYIARLNDAPRYIGEVTGVLRAGAEAGWTQPCAPMEGFEDTISFHVVDDAKKSSMWKPFEERPATIPARDWSKLTADGEKAINAVIPAIAAFGDFYKAEYKPHCRQEIGASSLPDGAAYYAWLAKGYTTTTRTPDDIHKLGLSEVKRLRKEMDAVIKTAGFKGDFKAFQNFLRTDPQFYATMPEELMEAYALAAKKMDGELPKLFTRLPRMPYGVKEIPDDIAEGTTTAYYEPPAGDGSRAGMYRINVSKLDTRPLYEVEALTFHESAPGHHFQIALAQELTLPEFRQNSYITAFVEGWGLYAESLGLDVGFYKDPYSNFGRLSYEMWRACRLVVDTGIHSKGWSRQQAIDYMTENTALSEHNITAEVDRYIATPGQALAYKIGQLKIRELRERASKQLGAKFDLRRFHDAVLENGAIPLSVLEAKIDAFIAAEKAR